MYYTDVLTNPSLLRSGDDWILRVDCSRDDLAVQCYQSGLLVDAKAPVAHRVEFILSGRPQGSTIAVLAVDPADATTGYYDQIALSRSAPADRIRVSLPARMRYAHDSRWRVAIDGTVQHEASIHPAAFGAGGVGMAFGLAFGFDPNNVPGFGEYFGPGELGFDCRTLHFTTLPLASGTYTIDSTVILPDGQVIESGQTTETLTNWPRPAVDLQVEAYDPTTDQLDLSWTPSEDI